MSSQRVWCPPEPWVTNCSGCGCTALGDPLWVKKLLELSSMPTAVLGNFPQPECLRICLWSQITCHLKITVKHSSILRPWMCWTSSGPSKSPWCQQSPLVFLWPFCSCPLWPLRLALLTVVMPWERKLLVRTEWQILSWYKLECSWAGAPEAMKWPMAQCSCLHSLYT